MGTAAEWAQGLADYIDRQHPKLGSALMKLRWGGLRTVEPSPAVIGGVLGLGVGAGLGVRHVVVGRSSGAGRVPRSPAAALGAVVAWLSLWRWDARRWRTSHVMVVVDLPDERLAALIARLHSQGIDVQRWDRPRRADGPNRGLACRLRELRRVNAAIDHELSGVTP